MGGALLGSALFLVGLHISGPRSVLEQFSRATRLDTPAVLSWRVPFRSVYLCEDQSSYSVPSLGVGRNVPAMGDGAGASGCGCSQLITAHGLHPNNLHSQRL